MTLGEALRALVADRSDPAGWTTVMSELDRLARSSSVVPQHREDSVSDVLEKLLHLVADPGWLDRVAHPEAYVRTMLVNRSRSLNRREKRRREKEAHGPAPVPPLTPPPPVPDAARLQELYRAAYEKRPKRYRHHLEAAWADLCRVLEGETLGAALAARGEEPTRPAVNAAYKAQERLRKAMLAVIDDRRASGRWTPDDAEVYQEEVRLLLRCQGRGLSGVSGGEVRHVV